MAEEASFVDEVLTPLVAGQTLTVRAPIDADRVEELVSSRHEMSGFAELVITRGRFVRELLYTPPELPLDRDTIRLGAAIHNLCWLLAQPRSHELRGTALKVASYTARLARLDPPGTEAELVARHSVVATLRTLTRDDVRVRFWAGEQTFLGAEPPTRLLRWQSVRRVREERSTVRLFDDALSTSWGKAIVTALYRSSPLTDLLSIERADPPVDLRLAARWLAQPHIGRIVADAYLARGLASVEGPYTHALVALYGVESATREAAIATAFHSHLHLLDVIARAPRDREGHLQIVRGYVQGKDRAVTDGFGIHAAAVALGLGGPGDLDRDATLARNVGAYAEACTELVGTRRVQELATLVARGAGRALRVA